MRKVQLELQGNEIEGVLEKQNTADYIMRQNYATSDFTMKVSW